MSNTAYIHSMSSPSTLTTAAFLPFSLIVFNAWNWACSISITVFIIIIARWMFGILVGMGIIMSLYSAFLYMFSGGATEKIDAARKTLTYAIVALAIGVFSGGLGVLIQNLLNNAATTSNVETVGGGAGGTTPTANPSNSPVPTGSTPTTPTTPPTNSGSGSAFSDFFDDFDFSGDF